MFRFLLDLLSDIWDFITYPIRLRKAWGDIDEIICDYESRVGDENRFLVSIKYLQEAFPDFKRDVIRTCWKRLREEGRIFQDQMDGQWVIR